MSENKSNIDTTEHVTERLNDVLSSNVNVPANRIQAIADLQRPLITSLRKGEISLDNVTFKKDMTLYEYASEILKKAYLFSSFITTVIFKLKHIKV